MIPGGANREDLRRIADNIRDALLELEIQRRRLLEAHGPSYSEVQDLGRTIDRLREDLTRIESIVAPTTPSVESLQREEAQLESRLRVVREAEAELERRASARPAKPPEIVVPTPAELRQYYVYYWFVISRDQLNFWAFYYDTRSPTQEEAGDIVERAIKELGYWQLVQDTTIPTDLPLLFREDEGIEWGWETGVQEPPIELEPTQAFLRKLKIRDWLEHPEPQRPKELVVRVERIERRR